MLDQIDALLENAFLEGNSMTITNLPYGASEYSLLEIVAQKINTLNLCLVSLDENEALVKNILKILTDFIPILKNDREQSLVIAECMLRISAEEVVPVNILKCAVYNLNLLLDENEPVLNWLKNEESLEGYLLILGRRLPFVGDFECQSYIFETLCHIIYDNEDKHKWIHSWFTDDEKTRSMFLNWNLQHFEVESRKILNQINRRELNPRTYAYAATAVYFGNVQLKKLNGLEFWIDFNYDSKSISFFCKDFEIEDQDISESWETVVISSDNIESYSVQKKEDIKSIELEIMLNCPCRDLLVSQVPLFETNLVRMIFWIYVDISSHLKVIFGEPETLANDHVICNQKSQGSLKPRKVSLSVDAFGVRDRDDIVSAGRARKISASDVVEIHAQDNCEKSVKRISDSLELISLFDDNDKNDLDIENFFKNSVPSKKKASLSQKDKKSTFSEGRENSQKKVRKNSSTKLSESFSDEAYVISPTPANKQKGRKITMLTPNDLKDNTSSEAQNYFENHAVARENERNISYKTGFDEEAEDNFKNLNSPQSKNKKDDTSYNRQKKIRLYNINRDPVYDVPPSEQKKINATPIQKNPLPFNDFSHKTQNKSLMQSPLHLSDEDFCESKLCKISTDSLETKQKHNINNNSLCENFDKNEDKLSENNFLENDQTKDLEVKAFQESTSGNELHLSDKDTACRKPVRKKLKKGNDVSGRRKSLTNNILKRKPNDVEERGIFDEVPAKKQRKSAIKARELNKTMLEQKESSGSTEGLNNEKASNANLIDNENNEAFSTPPTKPVKKRRLKSVFLTDTETGSSNVSWIGGKKSCLFETPPKRFSRRIKNKQASKRASPKKRTYKSTSVNCKRKQDSNFPVNGFEIKSKSGLSDLENYELVVEKKKDNCKSSHLNHKPFTFETVSKAINAAMEEILNKQDFDNVSNTSNIKSNMCDNIPEFHYNGDLPTDESVLNKNLNISNRKPTNISGNDLKSHIANESSTFKIKQSSSEERHSGSEKSVFKEKDDASNSDLQQKIVFNDRPLSSSVKKRKQANLSKPKEQIKRKSNDINNAQCINLDIVTHTNDFHAQDLTMHDENLQNIPSAFVTRILESPDTSEKEKNSFSSMTEKTSEKHHSTCLSPNVAEQSLSSVENNEAIGKDLHIQRFFEDLSGESYCPNCYKCADNFDIAFPVNRKTSKSNESSTIDNLLKYIATKNYLSNEIKNCELASTQKYIESKKKACLKTFEDCSDKFKASSEKDLQKFSSLENHSNSGLQEEYFDKNMEENNNGTITKINGRKPSMQLSILHVLGTEMDNMTHKLLKTLQKHFLDFNAKVIASREKILSTANALISKENDWSHKDLKNIAKTYKVSRMQAEKRLKKILLVGQEYFEAEKMLDHKMKRLHKKALKKYVARIKLAGTYAVEALEDRATAKTEVLLKNDKSNTLQGAAVKDIDENLKMTIENYESEEIISVSTTSETRENNPTKKNENDSEYQNFDGNSNLSNDHNVKDVDTVSMAKNKYLPPGLSDISRTRNGMPTRPDLESYPMHKDGKFFLSFTKNFYEYEWLEYSVSKDAVFCYYCKHFLHDNADDPFNDAIRVNGFRHWKKCYGKDNKENRLLKHQLSSSHCTAVQKIGIRESNEFRQSDVTIKKDVIDYGPHGGNFLCMLALVAKHDDIIARKIRNGPSNSKYTHLSIQKALLGIMAEEVQKEISNEVKKAEYFSICRRIKDLGKREQLSIAVRYLYNDSIYEEFLSVEELSSLNADFLTDKIIKVFKMNNINLEKCIGQAYDGASMVSGKHAGVDKKRFCSFSKLYSLL
ncbi:Synaptonemal complex protein 2 like protein [Argiope bruennichi]|uniref:Synaptonemal complex protein 2 like protein n=1 Tax=Argiope bruennichi TaxID=94029 RepID=A0A8T0ETE6_ARGBR|nr:Synaptonemal complex protein 2 like protein [Argiope bruennichi]